VNRLKRRGRKTGKKLKGNGKRHRKGKERKVNLLTLRDEDDGLSSAFASSASHALNHSDWRGVGIKAHDEIDLTDIQPLHLREGEREGGERRRRRRRRRMDDVG